MDQGYHSPHEDEDPERRSRQRDKFKRELDEDREHSPSRRRSPSPRERGSPRRRGSRSRSRSRDRNPAPPGRGRKDSPPFKRRKREDEWMDRSPESPRRRGRYDDYDDHDHPRRGGYHPRSGGRGTPRTPVGGLFDGPMLTYKQFLDHLADDRISPSDADKRFEDYQQEYKKRQAKVFFNEHKNDEWFKEKYEPAYLAQKHEQKISRAKEQVAILSQSLDSIDFNLSATLEDINKSLAAKHDEPKHEEDEDEEPSSTTSSDDTATAIFIKVIPSYISRTSVTDIFKNTKGFQRLLLSEPQRYKNFNRLGWCHYDTHENCANALKELSGNAKIGEFDLQLAINKTPAEAHRLPKITPPVAAEDTRITIDKEQAKLLVMQLDKEKGIDNNPLFNLKDSKSEEEMLDRYVIYLRRVHCYCYYCGEEYEDEDDLTKKCEKHLRGRKIQDSVVEVSSDPWAVSLDTKIKNRISNPDDPDGYTGKRLVEQKLEKLPAKTIVKVDDDKFRCSLCNKLFMADSFVKKHQSLKHADKLEEVKKKALEKQFFINYFNDPKRIMPIVATPGRRRPPPPSSSSSPLGGFNQQFFTPNRGRGGRKSMTPRQSPKEPPPGVSLDPRALKEYVDLDAPSEETVQIDYRIGDVRKKQKAKQ